MERKEKRKIEMWKGRRRGRGVGEKKGEDGTVGGEEVKERCMFDLRFIYVVLYRPEIACKFLSQDYVAMTGPVPIPRRHWMGISWSKWNETQNQQEAINQVRRNDRLDREGTQASGMTELTES